MLSDSKWGKMYAYIFFTNRYMMKKVWRMFTYRSTEDKLNSDESIIKI